MVIMCWLFIPLAVLFRARPSPSSALPCSLVFPLFLPVTALTVWLQVRAGAFCGSVTNLPGKTETICSGLGLRGDESVNTQVQPSASWPCPRTQAHQAQWRILNSHSASTCTPATNYSVICSGLCHGLSLFSVSYIQEYKMIFITVTENKSEWIPFYCFFYCKTNSTCS